MTAAPDTGTPDERSSPAPPGAHGPVGQEYERRQAQWRTAAEAAAKADWRAGAAKLALFFLLIGLAWLAWVDHAFSGEWLWPGLALLLGLFVWHDRILRRRARAERLVEHYERGLARLDDRWNTLGTPDRAGERFRDGNHPYADDLDLFGMGSLFHLLSLARTPMGEETLAGWLRAPAAPPEIAERQQRVAELRDQLDLRERVMSLGDELKQRMDPERFAAWARQPARPVAAMTRSLYVLLGAATLAAAAWMIAAASFAPFFTLVLVQVAILHRQRRRIEAAIRNLGANGEGLTIFAEVLACRPGNDGMAATALRRLARLADWMDASGTTIGLLLDFTVLYSLHLTAAAEAWRRDFGPAAPGWLAEVGEFEALLSLASQAYEHPQDPFPELAPEGELDFAAEGLGHPLLPERHVVRNDVKLDAAVKLLLVSGSNMAGKSTLLRAVGCNAVLAQMGAPVRAQRLRIGPLMVGTRLRTADSLQQGRSGFYAEILRLRQIFELSRAPLPLLYLFDELLEGTNSHDRVVGAEALLRALVERPALGMVTTHDLALAAMAERLGPRVRNVHLEDQIEGGDVRFDYKLRQGVVTKSNALALMRIVGLEV